VVAEEFDQFVDDFGFMFLARPSVTITRGGQNFLTCDLTHLGVHGSVTPFLSQRMLSSNHFTPLPVTIFLSQFVGFSRQPFPLNLWRGAGKLTGS
jgi:hypothetical protein